MKKDNYFTFKTKVNIYNVLADNKAKDYLINIKNDINQLNQFENKDNLFELETEQKAILRIKMVLC